MMVVLKNLSEPKSTHYSSYSVSENNEIKNVDWYLKNKQFLTEEEENLISRINHILNLCEVDMDFRSKVKERIKIEFNDTLPRITIQSAEQVYLHFGDEIKVYDLTACTNSPNIETHEFEKFVAEQHIPIVFTYSKYDTNENNRITKSMLMDFFGTNSTEAIYTLLKVDFDCYNNLLKKVNFELPIVKKYCCLYNGLQLVAENKYHCSVDAEILMTLIILLHFDDVIKTMDEQFELEKIEQAKEIEKRQIELANRVQTRIEALKERILNDQAFKVCERKNAIKYLKTLMKEYEYKSAEDYEVLEYLELSRTQYGDIRSKGYKGQAFIDDLWIQSREKH